MGARGRLTLPRSTRARWRAAAAGPLLLGACVVGVWALSGDTATGTASTPSHVLPVERSRYDNGQGYVTQAAKPVALQAAQPRRPLTPVPLIVGSGPCLAAMDTVREVMHAVPSGGLLPQAPSWARLVAARMGAVNATCATSTAQAFRDQEFLPWTNATIPNGAVIPPAPSA